MTWKSVSKISRNPEPAPVEPPSPTPEVIQPVPVVEEEKPSPLSIRLDEMSEEERIEDATREGLMASLKEQYLAGRPFDLILKESGVARATLFRWRKQHGWDAERDRKAMVAKKLAESLAFYDDPKNTEQALAQANLQLLLRIQGVNLSKLASKAAVGEAPDVIAMAMADSLSKYSGMLEKLIKSDQSIKSGGVERREVVHIQALDMDDAVRLALEMKRKGQAITVQEAMSLLTAQQAKKVDGK